jgi:hypothetical protein
MAISAAQQQAIDATSLEYRITVNSLPGSMAQPQRGHQYSVNGTGTQK